MLILVLAAGLRFYRLGAENFWIDEVFSMQQIEAPGGALTGFWDLGRQTTSRPLGLTLLYWSIRLGGDSEFMARLPFAILSILDVLVLYLLAREIVGREVALRAALFLAFLPLHLYYAQEARWYAQWALLASLSFLMLVRAWKSGRLGWWLGYVATVVLALYTYVVSLQLLIVQAVAAWFLPDRGSRTSFRVRFLFGVFLLAVLALPVYYVAFGLRIPHGIAGGVGTPRSTSLAVLPYTFFAYVAGYTVGPTLAELHGLPSPAWILREYPEIVVYYATFMPLAALGLWALRRRPACAAILLPWVAGLPLLVFVSALMAGQTYNVRYTFAAVPGFALLLSLGVQSLGRWRGAGTLLVVALFAFSLGNYYWNPRYDKEDVRSAITHVRGSEHSREPVATVGQAVSAADYYGGDLAIRRLYGCRQEGPPPEGRVPAVPLEQFRTESTFWVLVSRDWRGRSDVCMDALEPSHRIVEERNFTGVDLFRAERR